MKVAKEEYTIHRYEANPGGVRADGRIVRLSRKGRSARLSFHLDGGFLPNEFHLTMTRQDIDMLQKMCAEALGDWEEDVGL